MVDFWGRLLLHVVASRQYLDQHSPLNCTGSGGFVDRFVDSIFLHLASGQRNERARF